MTLADLLSRPVVAELARRSREAAAADPAHDFSHSIRVLANALKIASREGGDLEVLGAAAFLHDIANLPKNHPDTRMSSERSAKKAREMLEGMGFAAEKLDLVEDAVLCHSFSRGLTPKTREGRIFQDADRLDAIGAIGVVRTFTVGGATGRALYSADDPFLVGGRAPDDQGNTVDHFYLKLLKLGDRMQTETGRRLARARTERMRRFLADLQMEIQPELEQELDVNAGAEAAWPPVSPTIPSS